MSLVMWRLRLAYAVVVREALAIVYTLGLIAAAEDPIGARVWRGGWKIRRPDVVALVDRRMR